MKTVWVGGMDADAIAGWFSSHSQTFQSWLSFDERRELKQFAEEIERDVDAQRMSGIRSPGIDISASRVRKILALAKKAYQQRKKSLKRYGGTPGDRELLASYKDEVVDTLSFILKPIVSARSNGDRQGFGIPREQIDDEIYYTIWEKVPSGRWVIERSYKGRYILDALMDGIEGTWTTARPYAVFFQGRDPNVRSNPLEKQRVDRKNHIDYSNMKVTTTVLGGFNDAVRGATKALWLSAWMQYQEEGKYSGSGGSWEDLVPSPPRKAKFSADSYLKKVTKANKRLIGDLMNDAAKADGIEVADNDYAEDFGYYITMMGLNQDVSWFDDHMRFPLKIPPIDVHYDGEELHVSM
jgi:hypothetical protein